MPVSSWSEACGPEGIWVQILGAGGTDLNDNRAGPGFLVWVDGESRLLVGAGPGVNGELPGSGGTVHELCKSSGQNLHVCVVSFGIELLNNGGNSSASLVLSCCTAS